MICVVLHLHSACIHVSVSCIILFVIKQRWQCFMIQYYVCKYVVVKSRPHLLQAPESKQLLKPGKTMQDSPERLWDMPPGNLKCFEK